MIYYSYPVYNSAADSLIYCFKNCRHHTNKSLAIFFGRIKNTSVATVIEGMKGNIGTRCHMACRESTALTV